MNNPSNLDTVLKNGGSVPDQVDLMYSWFIFQKPVIPKKGEALLRPIPEEVAQALLSCYSCCLF